MRFSRGRSASVDPKLATGSILMTSMLRGTLAPLAFTSTVWLAAPAAAADDRETCLKESGDAAIAACTRAINSGRYSGRQLAVLLVNRCAEWPDKQENG